MPTIRLTDAAVQRLKTQDGADRTEFWDTATQGLGLRVSASGGRAWVMILRTLQAGVWKQQRVTLGKYPSVSLADARQLALEARTRAEQGGDPASVRKEQRTELERDSRNTFSFVCDEFLTKYRGRQNRRPAPRTLSEIKRVFQSDLFDDWRDRPLAQITRRNVLDVLDVLVDRGAEVMANQTLAYLGMLFAWAVDRAIIEADPTDRVKKPGAVVTRDRALSPGELRSVWKATAPTEANHGDLFASIVKVLILTGQRRDEVGRMRWSEIDGSTWTLPSARSKNRREHIVHLSAPVLAILNERNAEQEAMGMNTDYVFTSTGRAPFSGWSKSKARLDARAAIAPWRIHDLRRTAVTRMAEDLRTPPHIIEAIINHVSGTRAGVAGNYNRALYLDERKAALEAWAAYILRLVGETEVGNVVELTPKTRRS